MDHLLLAKGKLPERDECKMQLHCAARLASLRAENGVIARLPTGLLSAGLLVAAASMSWLSKKDAGSWLDWGVVHICSIALQHLAGLQGLS